MSLLPTRSLANTPSAHQVKTLLQVSLEENQFLESTGTAQSLHHCSFNTLPRDPAGIWNIKITDKGDLNQCWCEALQGEQLSSFREQGGRVRDYNLHSQKDFISILISESLAVSFLASSYTEHSDLNWAAGWWPSLCGTSWVCLCYYELLFSLFLLTCQGPLEREWEANSCWHGCDCWWCCFKALPTARAMQIVLKMELFSS